MRDERHRGSLPYGACVRACVVERHGASGDPNGVRGRGHGRADDGGGPCRSILAFTEKSVVRLGVRIGSVGRLLNSRPVLVGCTLLTYKAPSA